MTRSPAARKAANKAKLKRYRDKRKRNGLMRVETWVRPEHAEAVRKFAKETGYCTTAVATGTP